MTDHHQAHQTALTFFEAYADVLIRRDAEAIAGYYGVPALIEFPEASIPVGDREQTREFFAQAFGQYDGVDATTPHVTVVAAGPHSIWADVAWDHHGGAPDERNMYQLVHHDGAWKIAVLTPLAMP